MEIFTLSIEVLNNWLTKNGGYEDTDDLIERYTAQRKKKKERENEKEVQKREEKKSKQFNFSVVPQINTKNISWVGPLFNNTALTPVQIKSFVSDMHSVVIINLSFSRFLSSFFRTVRCYLIVHMWCKGAILY